MKAGPRPSLAPPVRESRGAAQHPQSGIASQVKPVVIEHVHALRFCVRKQYAERLPSPVIQVNNETGVAPLGETNGRRLRAQGDRPAAVWRRPRGGSRVSAWLRARPARQSAHRLRPAAGAPPPDGRLPPVSPRAPTRSLRSYGLRPPAGTPPARAALRPCTLPTASPHRDRRATAATSAKPPAPAATKPHGSPRRERMARRQPPRRRPSAGRVSTYRDAMQTFPPCCTPSLLRKACSAEFRLRRRGERGSADGTQRSQDGSDRHRRRGAGDAGVHGACVPVMRASTREEMRRISFTSRSSSRLFSIHSR